MTRETRTYKVELRAKGLDTDKPVIEGYAAVFNELSDDLGGFRERIEPGAFTEALAEGDVRAFWNHDSNLVLGRQSNDTLELREDDHGLAFKAHPAATPEILGKLVLVERGDVDGASFGFVTVADMWDETGDIPIRTLVKIKPLFEVSAGVALPAYPQTAVDVRHGLASLTNYRQLREHGVDEIDLLQRELRLRRLSLNTVPR